MNNEEFVKNLEKVKSTITAVSFDGWIENDGKNCDWDHKTDLLKKTDALKAINEIFPQAPCLACGTKNAIHTIVLVSERFGLEIKKWQCFNCGSLNYPEHKLPKSQTNGNHPMKVEKK